MMAGRGKRLLRAAWRLGTQLGDPRLAFRAMRNGPAYVRDYLAYFGMQGAEPRLSAELYPCLHDRAPQHEFDAHYFYVNPWAARRILSVRPSVHVDVASQTVLATILSASVPVMYVDYRALTVRVEGMTSVAGDLLQLPFRDRSVPALSCLHVAEHVGLGRYGDTLNPEGTKKAAQELTRVLAPGGNLFFAVPVGRERVVFNAHRVHAAETIRRYFAPLTLREFSGVTDDGTFVERASLDRFEGSEYACGFFWFVNA
jgi:SAM-dependent methyltransferase